MNKNDFTNNPYLLLTPGPLTTTDTVKLAMMKDWCTWDDDYNNIVQDIRKRLVGLATESIDQYSAVLMQGSGTFSVESVIGTVLPRDGKLLVIANGVYGSRIVKIAKTLGINTVVLESGEVEALDLNRLTNELENDSKISHVAIVHCETTTGMLNPIEKVSEIVKRYNRVFIVDAMSSFGGVEMDIASLNIDYLISSANKCIEGVPGFGFAIVKKDEFEKCKNNARSVSLDLYDQWKTMEEQNGKWRFTSPTHVVRAFAQALKELEVEGGIKIRASRYKNNQMVLSEGMKKLQFEPILPGELQSPIITSFYYPESEKFNFKVFYQRLKEKGFVIYPGKVSALDTFRIGNIGNVHQKDIEGLLQAIEQSSFWLDAVSKN
ncbi:2-aminoethylphosphonate--pyruvate transaminase [Bacillus salipaludis]|uniref:2-aminoethylphosphonate--pyruvate transaminase n=1 Tax=Bacillus salipaludis TaxID=2547811 RepID=A0A4V6PME7_9BACI|nr:2-aminoethylphosphonate--pyruvate transaminase [Bacillus salipaludis]MDQ6598564.1 2-aminoethylphosphonate--pyruvate transaminase [Bacillus salipaludis]TDK60882.1 2-aminoethylphosphonate--pyruvate transaminase [Bacillus salipaludis]